ncbi:MAG: carbon starvation protein A, partial [Alistipes sp.]|nr:carbon starvation protein A [Alistipes sp.]
MITFLVCLVLLVVAYFAHGSYLERVCKIDPRRAVPSQSLYDGVDYVPMSRWRTFLIQLLNIAGIGPIFGAIMGACFGPVAFLWITLGGIFMGAMHDFLSGVMLVRNEGLSISEIVGRYMGRATLQFMRIFSIILLILVGVVFLRSPASILGEMIPSVSYWWWIGIIIVYYFVATLLPIDKIIGKLYPLFGAALIFMAIGLAGVILFGEYTVPELSLSTLRNYQPNAESLPIVPTLFITIACGAISGFHATQSPLMARCIKSEGDCRSVFYGAMITESIIALIWAAIAMAFFHGPDKLAIALAE